MNRFLWDRSVMGFLDSKWWQLAAWRISASRAAAFQPFSPVGPFCWKKNPSTLPLPKTMVHYVFRVYNMHIWYWEKANILQKIKIYKLFSEILECFCFRLLEYLFRSTENFATLPYKKANSATIRRRVWHERLRKKKGFVERKRSNKNIASEKWWWRVDIFWAFGFQTFFARSVLMKVPGGWKPPKIYSRFS